MQTANIMLALGGNLGQTIPKFGVTPAEVAVLREIHGNASVFDIQPLDEDVERTSRQERSRLLELYGKPPGSREMSAVEYLFPGAAARVYESFDELEIDESFFKATGRAKAKRAAPTAEPEVEDEDEDDVVEQPKPKAKSPPLKVKPKAKKSTKSLFK